MYALYFVDPPLLDTGFFPPLALVNNVAMNMSVWISEVLLSVLLVESQKWTATSCWLHLQEPLFCFSTVAVLQVSRFSASCLVGVWWFGGKSPELCEQCAKHSTTELHFYLAPALYVVLIVSFMCEMTFYGFNCISLGVNDMEHLFMGLFDICIFFGGISLHSLPNFESSLCAYILYINC